MEKARSVGALLALAVGIVACGDGPDLHYPGPVGDDLVFQGRRNDPSAPGEVSASTADAGTAYTGKPFVTLDAPDSADVLESISPADGSTVKVVRWSAFARPTLRWKSGGVDAVRIDVSPDSGVTWDYLSPESESIPAALGAFTFTVPGWWAIQPMLIRIASTTNPADVHDMAAIPVRAYLQAALQVTEVRVGTADGLASGKIGDPFPNPRGGFVELVSRVAYPLDLTGWQIKRGWGNYGDYGFEPLYRFPALVLPARGVLLLWGDDGPAPVVPSNVTVLRIGASTMLRACRVQLGDCLPVDAWSLAGPLGFRGDPYSTAMMVMSPTCFSWEVCGSPMVAQSSPPEADPLLSGPVVPSVDPAWDDSTEMGGRFIASPGWRADGLPFGAPLDKPALGVLNPDAGPVLGLAGSVWRPCANGPGVCSQDDGTYTSRAEFEVVGGVPPYRYDIETDATLPAGVSLSVETLRNQRPRIVATGNGLWAGPGVAMSATLRITDSAEFPQRVRVPVRWFVMKKDARTAIATTAIPSATVGRLYEGALHLTSPGVDAAAEWRVTAGSLPPGLALSTPEPIANIGSNHLSGTPTTPGIYTFTITASWQQWSPEANDVITATSAHAYTVTVK